jgi:hypothetical protein
MRERESCGVGGMAWEGVGVVMLGQRCRRSWSVVDFVDLCHLYEKDVSACLFIFGRNVELKYLSVRKVLCRFLVVKTKLFGQKVEVVCIHV